MKPFSVVMDKTTGRIYRISTINFEENWFFLEAGDCFLKLWLKGNVNLNSYSKNTYYHIGYLE